MSPQKQHVMHGRDHRPSGADPIPGMKQARPTYLDLIRTHPCTVHYWPCDEPTGNLVDRIGSLDLARNASPSGWPHYGAAGPFSGSTAVENYGTGGVTSPDKGNFQSTTNWVPSGALPSGAIPFTVEFWTYVNDYDPAVPPFIVQIGANLQFYLWATTGPAHKVTFQYGTHTMIDTVDLPLSQWHHVVATYDGATVSLYRNTSLLDTDTAAYAVGPGLVILLGNTYSGGNPGPLRGRIAQLAVYNCALTATEVTDHYMARNVGSIEAGPSSEDNTVIAPGVPDGVALVGNGEEGTEWGYPMTRVYLNGA